MTRRRVALAATAAFIASLGCTGPAAATEPVPKATCRAGDSPETGLQGQVPVADRASGRAAQGYWCNLEMLGSYVEPGRVDVTHGVVGAWATLDTYEHCAYFGDSAIGQVPTVAEPAGGVIVVDIADPRHPRQTAYLSTPAMQAPWEALRVNARRGLLVADRNGSHALDVYSVSQDCEHPRLLFSGDMPDALGHEGYFAPDGRTFYMADGATGHLYPIDLTDPRHPKQLAAWSFDGAQGFHGGSVSNDGNTAYQCEYTDPGSVRVLDVSGAQSRRSLALPKTLAQIPLPNDKWCQATYPVTYHGRPYLLQYGETSQERCPQSFTDSLQNMSGDVSNFDYPRIIDIADRQHPTIVASLRTEVDEPANCPLIQGDISPRSVTFAQFAGGGGAVFGYDDHHCSPDRLDDPTILACGQFLSGLRIYDIHEPLHPRELAYYSKGTVSVADQTVDDAVSRPVVLTDRGLVVWTTEFTGLHIASFEGRVWPPAGAACGHADDYYFAQYNPRSPCFSPAPVPRPSRRPCVSRRLLSISLRNPRGDRIVSARVYINGRSVRAVRLRGGHRWRVDLRGRPKASFRVRVVARTRKGHRLRSERRYRVCARQ
jgi:hypothetical protein